MMEKLAAPSAGAKSWSVWADWCELVALSRADATTSEQLLLHELDLDDSGEAKPEGGDAILQKDDEPLDTEILERGREEFISRVATELYLRAGNAGYSYPFTFTRTLRGFRLKNERFEGKDVGRTVYVFCLLISTYRSKLLSLDRNEIKLDPYIGGLFQICACLAVGAYLHGNVSWLGWPRPERDAFLPALARILKRVGFGGCPPDVPHGFPKRVKDAGIDVIAWKEHVDGRPGAVFIIGQCASGHEEDKSVFPDLNVFSHWLHPRPFDRPLPALFVPHPIYSEHEQSDGLLDEGDYRQFYVLKEARFGIIFDRVRIAALAAQSVSVHGLIDQIEGAKSIDDLYEWVTLAVSTFRQVGVAA